MQASSANLSQSTLKLYSNPEVQKLPPKPKGEEAEKAEEAKAEAAKKAKKTAIQNQSKAAELNQQKEVAKQRPISATIGNNVNLKV